MAETQYGPDNRAAYLCLCRSSMYCSFWYSFAVRQLTFCSTQPQHRGSSSSSSATRQQHTCWRGRVHTPSLAQVRDHMTRRVAQIVSLVHVAVHGLATQIAMTAAGNAMGVWLLSCLLACFEC
jgi:hypothetical protein